MKYIYLFILMTVIVVISTAVYATVFYSESITVNDTPIGVGSAANDPEVTMGIFSVEGGNVRYWLDGTVPTSTSGHILYQNDYLKVFNKNNIAHIKFIRTGSSTTTIRASYEK